MRDAIERVMAHQDANPGTNDYEARQLTQQINGLATKICCNPIAEPLTPGALRALPYSLAVIYLPESSGRLKPLVAQRRTNSGTGSRIPGTWGF